MRGVCLEITKNPVERRRVWSERRERKNEVLDARGILGNCQRSSGVEKGMVGNTFVFPRDFLPSTDKHCLFAGEATYPHLHLISKDRVAILQKKRNNRNAK